MKFHIVSDSSCDLPDSYTAQSGISIVPFYISFDGENYLRERTDIPVREFYQQMAEKKGIFPKTSMPSISDYAERFLPYAKEKIPVLCICLNASFSGSMQSARTAAQEVCEMYPEAEITVMDSREATGLQGLLVKEAVELRDAGRTLKEAEEALLSIRDSGRIFFTANDLEYLRNGGRIGKAAAIAGSMLKVKPLIGYEHGELVADGISRGRKKSLVKAIENAKDYIRKHGIDLKEYRFAAGCGLDLEEFEEFCGMVLREFAEFGITKEKMDCFQIGATIGVHTGPGPIGVGILKRCI